MNRNTLKQISSIQRSVCQWCVRVHACGCVCVCADACNGVCARARDVGIRMVLLGNICVYKIIKHSREREREREIQNRCSLCHVQVWKEKREEEMKVKMAESARYKSYRRYLKKGGPGQMTFGPE